MESQCARGSCFGKELDLSCHARCPRLLLGFLLALGIGGCAAEILPSELVFSPQLGWQGQGERPGNEDRLRHYIGGESQFYAGGPGKRPSVCLALSGGGMRSAAFSIGALQGLHETGILEQVDVAASVSGGAYALSWYMVQHFDRFTEDPGYDVRGLDRELFAREGPYQQRLRDNFELFALPLPVREGYSTSAWESAYSTVKSAGQFGVATLATLVSIPVNLIANGLFGWHANVSPLRRLYENSIERAFHADPAGDKIRPGLGFAALGRRDEVEFSDLRALLRSARASPERKVPMPIFSINLNYTTARNPRGLDLANRLVEFTPLRYGVDSVGYFGDFEISVSRAVAISGAAVDSDALLDAAPEILASALNLDLGYHHPNRRIDRPHATREAPWYRSRTAHWFYPFPFYFLSRWDNDPEGIQIHLTDGGHAENLGIFPLARRLCEQIVVVDGTQDGDYKFEDYERVRTALAHELGMAIRMPRIDRWLAFREALRLVTDEIARKGQSPPGAYAGFHRGYPELAVRLWDALVELDRDLRKRPSDQPWCAPADAGLRGSDEALHDGIDCVRRALDLAWGEEFDPKHAVALANAETRFDGSVPVDVGFIAVPHGAPPGGEKIPVTYVKLSLSAARCGDCETCGDGPSYHPDTCAYWKAQSRSVGARLFGASAFPHETTADVSYEPLQYLAYRELGRNLVCWGSARFATAPQVSAISRQARACAQ